jgi:hypothetical protein
MCVVPTVLENGSHLRCFINTTIFGFFINGQANLGNYNFTLFTSHSSLLTLHCLTVSLN